jgi:hypothetical protein
MYTPGSPAGLFIKTAQNMTHSFSYYVFHLGKRRFLIVNKSGNHKLMIIYENNDGAGNLVMIPLFFYVDRCPKETEAEG